MLSVTTQLHVQRERAGRKRLSEKPAKEAQSPSRVPHIARMMALAIRFQGMLEAGVVRNQTELARLARVTQPRMTQILNLTFLAPEIQEALLFLGSETAVSEKALRQITMLVIWNSQRRTWKRLI